MKLEMTQKDKNLLIMLSIFVIVVCIGYWGIYPVVKEIVKTNKEIVTQEETQEENELKLTQVPMMEADNEKFLDQIQGVRESFFPMMQSAEIDKYYRACAWLQSGILRSCNPDADGRDDAYAVRIF